MKYNLYSKYNITLYDLPSPSEVLKYRLYGNDCCIESIWKNHIGRNHYLIKSQEFMVIYMMSQWFIPTVKISHSFILNVYENKVKVAQSCPTLCDPMDYTQSTDFSRPDYWGE